MIQDTMERKNVIKQMIEKEWEFFGKVNNIGGRAECQDDFTTFQIMRSSQFEAWDDAVLYSYDRDLDEAKGKKQNLVEQKYAYMMKETSPEYFRAYLEPVLPAIDEKKEIVEQILECEILWYRKAQENYPYFTARGRAEQESGEYPMTSICVYLRGELYTYSKETLIRYLRMIQKRQEEGVNLICEIYKNTVRQYGYPDLETAERELKDRCCTSTSNKK